MKEEGDKAAGSIELDASTVLGSEVDSNALSAIARPSRARCGRSVSVGISNTFRWSRSLNILQWFDVWWSEPDSGYGTKT